MKILTMVLSLLHIQWTMGSHCTETPIVREGVKATAPNCSLSCLDWRKLNINGVTKLSLESCRISQVINISQNSELIELNLMNNEFEQLPKNLLLNFENLKVLNVNGNPLKSIPLSIIQGVQVIFQCSCSVLKDLTENCNKAENCTQNFMENLNCNGANNFSVFNVSSFYSAECSRTNRISVYVLVPLLILGIGITICVVIKYSSKCNTNSSHSPNKRHSVSSLDHGQQRNPKSADDTYYLESDPACDIYLNEQPVYCNYTESVANPEDDVYIIPDK
ncbi:uncharacterized protein LOC109923212 isoform X2 [Rhincodon typus]|uniref:uncharacterized protein LOC109923212 isoform X2 n=1 Tax=Rhincodon typus TaxID=259920 RepID=UPI0020303004|nr:uncharacterized protein LOC109923212 isoform X2 [Rhincodon typus]